MAPRQKPGKSKQDYQTPKEFIQAVKNRLCIADFDIDLAASADNRVCEQYYGIEQDSLSDACPWRVGNGWSWLNPPYSHIEPWVEKAAKESWNGAHIAMLVPASVGANWWRRWVEPWAYQSYLNGRLTFPPETKPYPKDLALLLYMPWGFTGHEIWNWRSCVDKVEVSPMPEVADRGNGEVLQGVQEG